MLTIGSGETSLSTTINGVQHDEPLAVKEEAVTISQTYARKSNGEDQSSEVNSG